MKTILTLCALSICCAMTLRAADETAKKPGDGKHVAPEEVFKKLDTNGDGFLSKEEFLASPRAKKDPAAAEKRYAELDKKGDGKVTLEEFKAGMQHGKKPAGDAPAKPADAAK